MLSGKICSQPISMLLHPHFQVGCTPCIVTSVCTFQNIHISFHSYIPFNFPVSARPVSLSNRPITNNCSLRPAQGTDLYSTHPRPLGELVEPTDNQQLFPSTGSGNDFIFRQTTRSVSLSNRRTTNSCPLRLAQGTTLYSARPPAR